MSKIENLIKKVPSSIIHFFVCMLAAFVSLWLAIGLALGRESCNMFKLNDPLIRNDTIMDLIADALGIFITMLILW